AETAASAGRPGGRRQRPDPGRLRARPRARTHPARPTARRARGPGAEHARRSPAARSCEAGEVSGVDLLDWEPPGPYRIAFSTRIGGVSEGAFSSLNLGILTDDDPARVIVNRTRLCEAVGADPDGATMAWQ